MKNIRLYNTTTDFENDKSKRNELDYRVSLDLESRKVYMEKDNSKIHYD